MPEQYPDFLQEEQHFWHPEKTQINKKFFLNMSSAPVPKGMGHCFMVREIWLWRKMLNKIFAGRTVLVTVHTIPHLSMRNRRACALQFWTDLQKIFSMLQ